MSKQRRHFQVEDSHGEILGFGILYPEGNVSLSWRKSTGWTQEQHHSIAGMLGVEDGAEVIRITSTYPHYRPIPVEGYDENETPSHEPTPTTAIPVVINTPLHERTIVKETPDA